MKLYGKFDKKYKEIYTLRANHSIRVTYALIEDDAEPPEGMVEVITKNSKPNLLDNEELLYHMTRISNAIEKEYLSIQRGADLPPDVEVQRNIQISKKKLRDNLKAMGFWQDFKNLVYSDEELKELWEISVTLEEKDPYVQGAIQMIKRNFGIDDEAIEELLIASESDL